MTRPVIPVAAGCLCNDRGEVLICQRPVGKIAAGKWEFPGGKIEAGESAEQALHRELREELGVGLESLRPLIRVRHDYSDRTVELHVWRVDRWRGEPQPLDFQGLAWVAPDALPGWDLLAADVPIVRALQLPVHCAFTPAGGVPPLERLATPAQSLLRLRLPGIPDEAYREQARVLAGTVRGIGARLLLDRDPADVGRLGAAGFHATAARLATLTGRPVAASLLFGASCHSAAELARAHALGADYAVVGPVQATGTHPDASVLGWAGFEALVLNAGLPVYAIGGLGPPDLPAAWRHGAQGVAGISAYWRGGASSAGVASRSGSSSGIA